MICINTGFNQRYYASTPLLNAQLLAMNYLIAVLKDRIEAEEAYSALEKQGLPMDQVAIVGRGYKSADEFDLKEPGSEARKQAKLLAYWTIPLGFVAGFAFNLQTGIEIVEWTGSLGNHIIGGLFGAIAGAMGSFFAGGGTGLIFSRGDAFPYRNRLKEGKYLIAVQGSENLTLQASRILRQFNPENIQAYVDPASV